MGKETFLPGDIFLVDSDAYYAKMVKFLMQAPTVWQWAWRKLRGTQQEVRFYHAGMLVDDLRVIEQQDIVELELITAAFLNKPHIVYRNPRLSETERNKLVTFAKLEIGEKYDIILIFGKLFTWLTGLGFFTKLVQGIDREICVTRVAKWYQKVVGIAFGKTTWHEVTTDVIDDWCKKDGWEIVSIKLEKPKTSA
jgi:hypothetical protein